MVRCENCFTEIESDALPCPYCNHVKGQPAVELYHMFPGTLIKGRYIIGQVLGFGGFGITYKAWDKQFDAVVAIKEYYPSGLVNRVPGNKNVILFAGNRYKEYNIGLTRFLDEARNMAKFHKHPNIVNIFEFFEENNTAYIVMEYLDGITLNDFLKTNDLDIDSCIDITQKVCSALSEIHSQNIIHRDVSPDNIFLCMNDTVKLIDFGAARFSADEERKMTIILKPGYAPPEQYDSVNQQGPWTDIYALGATLYLMLTKVKPDESTNRKINDKVKAPRELVPEISEQISNTVMKAIALDYHFRFSNIKAFSEALLGNKKVDSLDKEKKKRKKRRLYGLLTAVLAIVLSFTVLLAGILDQRSNVTLPDAKIAFWYSTDIINSDALTELTEQFESTYNNVDVALISQPQARLTKDIPDTATLFISSFLDQAVLNSYTDDISDVWKFIDESELISYRKDDRQLPLGIAVPLRYENTSSPATITTDSRFKLISGDAKYYNGTNVDYLSIQKELAGKYRITTMKNEEAYFTDYVSLNKNASDDEKTVAIRFLAYLLSDHAQEALYVKGGSGAIPVNISAAEVFADVYSELAPLFPIDKKAILNR